MSEKKDSYRQVFRATSIFGGVQVINIIIAIIRSKFVAILLGPAGMGVVGLLTSTTGLITGLTNFGLSTSAVKNVASAYASEDSEKFGRTIAAFRRLVWGTGLLGFLLMLILAPWLSRITFKSNSHTIDFILISVTLLLTQLSSGQNVILQGTRRIQYMAKSSVFGAFIGLLTSIPLYYFLGEKGIVPAIIITSVTALILTWHFSNKVKIPKFRFDKELIYTEGKEMLKLGFLISVSGFITLGASYIVQIFISNIGGVGQVGLYLAGFAIINTYVGLIFSAMSTDYFPRLSAISHNNEQSRIVINEQAEIAILILAPIIIVFLVFSHWMVILLYSSKFISVTDMILWAALGMFFKAASWSIAFIFLAKGANRLFFLNEFMTNIYLLALNLLGYKLLGLTGLGISFMVAYLLYVFQVYFVAKSKYKFSFNKGFYKIFCIQLVLGVICFLLVKLLDTPYSYIVGSLVIVLSTMYSLKELDKRLGMKSIIIAIKERVHKSE